MIFLQITTKNGNKIIIPQDRIHHIQIEKNKKGTIFWGMGESLSSCEISEWQSKQIQLIYEIDCIPFENPYPNEPEEENGPCPF